MEYFLLQIFGFIEHGWTAREVQEKLIIAGGKDIKVQMNSIGGDVAEAVAIYNLLAEYKKEHDAKIMFDVIGYAQSCASYITTLPGAERVVHENTGYMYHRPNAWTQGDFEEIRNKSNWLESMTDLFAKDYSACSGQSVDDIATGMAAETYLFGQEIVDTGFADRLETTGAEMSGSREDMEKEAREKFAAAMAGKKPNDGKRRKKENNTGGNTPDPVATMEDIVTPEELKAEQDRIRSEEQERASACMSAQKNCPKHSEKLQAAFMAGKPAAYFEAVSEMEAASVEDAKAEAEKSKAAAEMKGAAGDSVADDITPTDDIAEGISMPDTVRG